MATSTQKIATFLTFFGKAEEAMNIYVSLFDRAAVLCIQRYGASEAGAEGSVKHATFSLDEQEFMCIDSPPIHDWTFTPAISVCQVPSRGGDRPAVRTPV